MKDLLLITKALSDANRVRAYMMLRDGELCLCQIIELLGLAPSTVSKHMSILYNAGLVDSRKDGKWQYYFLPKEPCCSAATGIREWLETYFAADASIAGDATQVDEVKKTDKQTLCCHYQKSKGTQ